MKNVPLKRLIPIPLFPNYFVSGEGEIWSSPRKGCCKWRKLKAWLFSGGYLRVALCKNKRRYIKAVHRLVLEAFVGPCPDGMECCHKNDVPADNRPENLRWDSHSNNLKDGFKNGKRNIHGEKNPFAKLSIEEVKYIKILLRSKAIKLTEIGSMFNVTPECIWAIKHGKTWRNV